MSRGSYGPYTGMKRTLFGGAMGINNRAEPHNLARDADTGNVELAEGVNIEIQDDLSVSSRAGRATVRAGQCHSMWADGGFCFFVDQGVLYRLFPSENVGQVHPSVGTARMSYALAMGRVYAANGSQQMIITDSTVSNWVHTPIQQSVSDKRTLGFPAPFNLVAWHSSRMLVACGNVLYNSELFIPGLYDLEQYLQFTTPIIELVSMRGGVYLSTMERTVFLPGADIASFKEEVHLRDVPMVPGTARVVPGRSVGKGVSGKCLMWVGPNGEVCVGSESGELLEVLDRQIYLEKHTKGGSVFRRGQFIFSLEE